MTIVYAPRHRAPDFEAPTASAFIGPGYLVLLAGMSLNMSAHVPGDVWLRWSSYYERPKVDFFAHDMRPVIELMATGKFDSFAYVVGDQVCFRQPLTGNRGDTARITLKGPSA